MHSFTLSIDESSSVEIPKKITIKEIDGEVLVIAQDIGLYIILINNVQRQIFEQIRSGENLKKIYQKFSEDDVDFIVSQIYDRNFFETTTLKSEEYDSVQIYLTNACNLRCPHCYMSSGKSEKKELKKEEWFSILEELKANNIREVIFSGGEIRMYNECFSVIKHAKQIGMRVRINTNGVLWEKEEVEYIKDFIDEVQISVDGINEEMNSKIRGKNSWAKALRTVEFFVQNNVKTIIATTPTYENIREMEKYYVDFALTLQKKYGKNLLDFIVSQKMLSGRGKNTNVNNDANMYENITHTIMNKIYPNYRLKNFVLTMDKRVSSKNCGYGTLTIASNGKIYLCNRIDELSNFSDSKNNFKDILKQALHYNELTSVDNILPCKTCDIRYLCGGGCRIDDFSFRGRHEKINEESITRICTREFKNRFYRQMRDGIKYLYGIE